MRSICAYVTVLLSAILQVQSAFIEPEDVCVVVGETAAFTCNNTDTTEPPYWNVNGSSPSNLRKLREQGFEYTDRTLSVPMERATLENDGDVYQCVFPATGVESRTATLRVVNESTPVIVNITADVGVLSGEDITLNCSAASPDGVVAITWNISSPSHHRMLPVPVETSSDGLFTSTIVLTSVESEDSGEYTCTAFNTFTSVSSSLNVSVITIYGVEDVEVTIGNNATLTCNATGHPDLAYSWERIVGGVFDDQDSQFMGENSSMLVLTNVGVADAMEYGCSVSLFGAILGTAAGHLTTRGPITTVDPMDMTLICGDTLELSCAAVNQPDSPLPLTFDWFHNDSLIIYPTTNSTTTSINTVANQLIVADVDIADTGDYHCLVYTRSSEDGVQSAIAQVMVNLPPPPTCISAGHVNGCCSSDQSMCVVRGKSNTLCYCDIDCYAINMCCKDIMSIGCLPNNCTEAGKLGCVVVGDELCDVLTPGGRNSCYCDVERCQKEGDCCADATSVTPNTTLLLDMGSPVPDMTLISLPETEPLSNGRKTASASVLTIKLMTSFVISCYVTVVL